MVSTSAILRAFAWRAVASNRLIWFVCMDLSYTNGM
jgi:hypothetical protein